MQLNDIVKLISSIVASFAAAGIGSLFTFRAIPNWYAKLRKPPYTPPNWAFGPIWAALYVMMAISVFLIWQKGLSADGVLVAFTLFCVQLTFNAFWSIIFFGMKSKGGGVITIILLWLLILATIITSFRVLVWAGALLIPYLLWVTVASYLNIGIWVMNKTSKR